MNVENGVIMWRKLNAFLNEMAARRAGRRMMSRDIQKAARHIIGPTGYNYSSAWQKLQDEDGSYLKSFDPRVPPSLHISHRDNTRANQPIPLVERRIEGWNEDEIELLSDADLEELRSTAPETEDD